MFEYIRQNLIYYNLWDLASSKKQTQGFFIDNRFDAIDKVYLGSILYIIYSQLFILRDKFNISKYNFYVLFAKRYNKAKSDNII